MTKVLLGTTNPSKVNRFSRLLAGNDIEFTTLTDLEIVDEPEEKFQCTILMEWQYIIRKLFFLLWIWKLLRRLDHFI